MATPTQQGTALKLLSAPTFSNFIVVDEGWKPKDTTQMEETLGGDSKTANFSFWNPGDEVSVEWVIKSAAAPAEVGQVITDGAGNKWLVGPGLETQYRGEKPAKQTLTLIARDSVTLA